MKRRQESPPAPDELPEELQRFDFWHWHRDQDIAEFESWEEVDYRKQGDIAERRWGWLAVIARQRWKAAKAVWRHEHLGEPLSRGIEEILKKHGL